MVCWNLTGNCVTLLYFCHLCRAHFHANLVTGLVFPVPLLPCFSLSLVILFDLVPFCLIELCHQLCFGLCFHGVCFPTLYSQTLCCGLNVCVPPPPPTNRPNPLVEALPQRDCIWRWDRWELIKVRRGHEGGGPMMGLVP